MDIGPENIVHRRFHAVRGPTHSLPERVQRLGTFPDPTETTAPLSKCRAYVRYRRHPSMQISSMAIRFRSRSRRLSNWYYSSAFRVILTSFQRSSRSTPSTLSWACSAPPLSPEPLAYRDGNGQRTSLERFARARAISTELGSDGVQLGALSLGVFMLQEAWSP